MPAELPERLDALRRAFLRPRKGKAVMDRYAPRAGAPLPPASCDMERLFHAHDGRLAHKWWHYLAVYDRLIGPYRHGFADGSGGCRPLRFLEIGVSQGGSQQLWRKFLGPDAIIFGVDVDPACVGVSDGMSEIRIGSQADAAFLAGVVDEMGGVDIVIDDGSHIGDHQRVSFEALFPRVSDGGLYLVEDTHTSYWPEWKGGLGRRGTAIELAKDLVDDQHGWYHDGERFYPAARSDIDFITFFDSIIAIGKRHHPPPVQVFNGRR